MSFYNISKRFLLKHNNEQPAGNVVSMTKKGYGFPVHFLLIFMKSF